MQKVAIIVDSIACLTKEMVQKYGISVLPLNFYYGGKIYRDWVDITPSEAYQLFLKDPESFKTSSVSPGECLEAYREVSKRSENILCITVSSKISAVYQAAQQAKEEIRAKLPHISITVLDSRTVAAAEGLIALAAAQAAVSSKSLIEVTKFAEVIRDKVSFYVFLNTIRHVYRSGRIPKVASQVGSILNIKPILTTASGTLHFIGVSRTKVGGVNRLLNILRDKVQQRPIHIAVTHAYAPEEAEHLKKIISSEFNCVDLWLTEFSPLMGYACGTGTIGIAFYSDE